jgi:hypothetical protein
MFPGSILRVFEEELRANGCVFAYFLVGTCILGAPADTTSFVNCGPRMNPVLALALCILPFLVGGRSWRILAVRFFCFIYKPTGTLCHRAAPLRSVALVLDILTSFV